jgi:NAD/NADP transhydrogenase alpha subunit
MGESNILNKLPTSASNLYAKMYLILFQIYMIKKTRKLI